MSISIDMLEQHIAKEKSCNVIVEALLAIINEHPDKETILNGLFIKLIAIRN